jgi:hypothetical protein
MIKQQKNRDNPFFCFASFYRPHQPYTPIRKSLWTLYDVSQWGKGNQIKK